MVEWPREPPRGSRPRSARGSGGGDAGRRGDPVRRGGAAVRTVPVGASSSRRVCVLRFDPELARGLTRINGKCWTQTRVRPSGAETVRSGRRALGPHGGGTAVHRPRAERPEVLSRGEVLGSGAAGVVVPRAGRDRGWLCSCRRPHPRCLPLPGGEWGRGPDAPCRPSAVAPTPSSPPHSEDTLGPQEPRRPTGAGG